MNWTKTETITAEINRTIISEDVSITLSPVPSLLYLSLKGNLKIGGKKRNKRMDILIIQRAVTSLRLKPQKKG